MAVPQGSQIALYLPRAFFADSWSVSVPSKNITAMTLYIESMRRMPGWANALMQLRNNIWATVGLKNLGSFKEILHVKHACDYIKGDRVGIFTVVSNEHHEVVLEDCDKHLNVRVSFYINDLGDQSHIAVTTVVHVKNWLGRLYMIPVFPIHKLILWRSMAQIRAIYKSQ
ncbi:DUF2867 domain-containing protein [Rhodanobacter aciditrophus]|uniref:DUF2867 domain-containing protein n=1 Tax=Rhodanobacter aciditrophus TaxID=1623218 RepID=A0ABW4AZH9_9GAMM